MREERFRFYSIFGYVRTCVHGCVHADGGPCKFLCISDGPDGIIYYGFGFMYFVLCENSGRKFAQITNSNSSYLIK